MKVKLFKKTDLQNLLRDIRKAGYTVEKESGIYKVKLDERELLVALNGSRGYLVRYDPEFLTEAK